LVGAGTERVPQEAVTVMLNHAPAFTTGRGRPARRQPWSPLQPKEPEPEKITCYGDLRRAMLPNGRADEDDRRTLTDPGVTALVEPYAERKARLRAEKETARRATDATATNTAPKGKDAPTVTVGASGNKRKKKSSKYVTSPLQRRRKLKHMPPRDRKLYMRQYHARRTGRPIPEAI
jgi:hypothetical protein